ncbi:unnamed protein product [Dibothriocephalus latus]|uniref:G-protein coupled receptors family 1 profile domain-containing protein n=1 Tax=Dibothriocephalus latus TaxID=60516 RepID=A0A3P7LMX7_DIBLA|nr:unnamed protein product [Dibothriocephalus latus]
MEAIKDRIERFAGPLQLSVDCVLNIIGLLLGVVGTITNAVIIINLIPRLFRRKSRAPNMKYSLAQAFLDCLACFSWCVCDYMKQALYQAEIRRDRRLPFLTVESGTATQTKCALYLSKSAFWALFAYRSGINVLAAAHFFRRLVFARVRMPIDTVVGIIVANIIFLCHAVIAAIIHGVEVHVNETMGSCIITRDLFAQQGYWVGPIKVGVVAHISLMYIFPVMSTMFFYTVMTSALRESRNPVHEKAYRDLMKIYYMDCKIYLVFFAPFICCFYLHHFSIDFEFGPADTFYKAVFAIAFAYPALYPLLGVYLRRNFHEPLMSGLDFYQSREEMEKTALKRSAEEKVAQNLEDQSLFSTKIQ